jgi:hypothetical protein
MFLSLGIKFGGGGFDYFSTELSKLELMFSEIFSSGGKMLTYSTTSSSISSSAPVKLSVSILNSFKPLTL